MKYSLTATSIVESLVVLLIVVVGVVGVFSIMNSAQKLSQATDDRIEAIQIARDGLEAFTNIRDTNWLLYSADLQNCWNTLNYDANCIWNTWNSTDITPWSYRIYRDSSTDRFILSASNQTGGFADADYRSSFEVFLDDRKLYRQISGEPLKSLFTRRILIEYYKADDTLWDSDDPKMKVTAIVEWNNSAKQSASILEIDMLLTNWKENL